MIQIVITPLGHGQFEAAIGGRILLESSRQPLLDVARVLLDEGVPPNTRIGMRHAGSPHIALSATIGKAAKLSVWSGSDGVPRFVPWKAQEDSGAASPTPFGEAAAPEPPTRSPARLRRWRYEAHLVSRWHPHGFQPAAL